MVGNYQKKKKRETTKKREREKINGRERDSYINLPQAMLMAIFTSDNSLRMLSRICRQGRLLFGNGANQSVSTLSILCSKKANCRSFLISCDITCLSIEIFFVAGFPARFSCRSSSDAFFMFIIN